MEHSSVTSDNEIEEEYEENDSDYDSTLSTSRIDNFFNIINRLLPNGNPISVYVPTTDESFSDAIMKKDIENIKKIFNFKYFENKGLKFLTKYYNLVHSIVDVVFNIYKNAILVGDIVSDLYLFDNRVDVFKSLNTSTSCELIFICHDNQNITFDNVINILSLMTKSRLLYYYSFGKSNFVSIDLKDSSGYIFTFMLHFLQVPNLFKFDFKSKSPYDLNDKIQLELTNDQLYNLSLNIFRFEHQKMAMIKNGLFNEYVLFDNGNNIFSNFYLDKLNSDLENIVIFRKLKYQDKSIFYQKEIEYYLKYDFSKKTKQGLILSRLNMIIQTYIILQFIHKNWEFENLKRTIFNKEDKCYICYNDYDDFNIDNNDIYKISYKCCNESENGICITCFINNFISCHSDLKSSFICPFCKKSNYFHNILLCESLNNY